MTQHRSWRERSQGPVLLARAAAAQVAADFVRPKHWIAQTILAVIAVVAALQGGWWWALVTVVVTVMAVLALLYWVVLRLIGAIGAPKALRAEMKDLGDELRAIFEDLRLPTGVVGSVAFALRLARGGYHERVPEAARRIQALLRRHGGPAVAGGDPGPGAPPGPDAPA